MPVEYIDFSNEENWQVTNKFYKFELTAENCIVFVEMSFKRALFRF